MKEEEYIIQRPPFCVQFEPTEGCNLACSFCGVQGMRERPNSDNRFMTIETAERIADMIARSEKWNPRLESCMHGEPTLNPNVFDVHRAFRARLPNLPQLMLSNGAFAREPVPPVEFIHELRRAGVNILAIDCYDYAKGLWSKIVKSLEEAEYPFSWYPDDKESNPHTRSAPWIFRVVMVRDISSQTLGTHSVLNTHCGAGMPPKVRMKPCAKVFRELSIRWDGNVSHCCNDFRGEYRIGSIWDYDTMDELWQSDRFVAARRKLYIGQRDFAPCNKCDAISYRPGLLPDQYGKESMNAPTEWDEERIREALAEGPYSSVVKREWEK